VNCKFYTCDVFTRERFGGNPLAVLPEAGGLQDFQMQQIAREFNYSETTFVLPPESGHTRRVRIFTPTREVPFAGHPNIGTAFVLASCGAFGEVTGPMTVTFEERAGPVPVDIVPGRGGGFRCELEAPAGLQLEQVVPAGQAAAALALAEEDIRLDRHPPQVAGVGLPFLVVELPGLDVLARAGFSLEPMKRLAGQGIPPDILVYVRLPGEGQIRARMFAPLDGVPEDPATGSANCALAALLGHLDPRESGVFNWRIEQGVEMGRPSLLEARVQKENGIVTSARIGGDCVPVSEGNLQL
jgi:trans-2,3-dihydro-3-hydroxyanthranilate isomerase